MALTFRAPLSITHPYSLSSSSLSFSHSTGFRLLSASNTPSFLSFPSLKPYKKTPISPPNSINCYHSPTPNLESLTLTPHGKKQQNSLSSATNPAPKTLKARLAAGEQLYGIFLMSFSPILAEIAGFSGYDFAVIDLEHGYGGISSALPILQALASSATPAIIRIPESSQTWAKKALDVGPQGIMFPMIESPKAAKKAVSYCKYPPKGVRGAAHPVIRASKYGIQEDYLDIYEDELLIMCQVESEEGVKKIDEIGMVDGVDCIQMGPLDLSASVGSLRDPGSEKAREVLFKAEKGVLGLKGGSYLAGFATGFDGAEDLQRRGYRMVSGAVDLALFRSVACEDVRRNKKSKRDDGESDGERGEKPKDEKYWSE
ncbi:hypothetical protein AMTRI_Chr09g19400 [Amborella trichopoda]